MGHGGRSVDAAASARDHQGDLRIGASSSTGKNMARRIRLADVNAAVLADVECIAAVDPSVPAYYTQVWTLTAADDVSRGGEAVHPPSPPNVLEVELDSDDPEQLAQLKRIVEAAKESFLEGMWDLKEAATGGASGGACRARFRRRGAWGSAWNRSRAPRGRSVPGSSPGRSAIRGGGGGR
jgi:hypothetical protein